MGVFRGAPGGYRPLKRKKIAKNSMKRSYQRFVFVFAAKVGDNDVVVKCDVVVKWRSEV